MTAESMVAHVRVQAAACEQLGSPLYAALLERVAGDVERGGPSAAVLRGHEEDPGPSALALRLMGGVHRIVLEGRAPELARTYPSVGGTVDVEAAWQALRRILAEHRGELRERLGQPPQTNEVGRAAALLGGLHLVVARHRRPLRLVEIGASGGLNLLADQFRVTSDGRRGCGPLDSPVVLRDAWLGVDPPVQDGLEVVERLGCDVAPVDVTTEDGRLVLQSYVWPDQVERMQRLRGATDLARAQPPSVVRSGAADFLDRLDLQPGTTTVVWHSVMWQYLDRAEQQRVRGRLDELGRHVDATTGLAHLFLEPRRRSPADVAHEFLVVLRTWPGAEQVLGTAHPHGVPTTWEPAVADGAGG